MSLLRSSGHQAPSYVPLYTGLQIQTSSNAVPIAIIYGTNRSSPNVIWTGGFFAIPQYSSISAGKGGSGNQLTGYNYYTSLAMGVCEGPITGYRSNFMGQGHSMHLASTGLGFAAYGTTPQSPWGFLTAKFPSQALNYNGLAYVGGIAVPLGASPNLPQYSFEIQGRLLSSAVLNGFDADPVLIIQDFLTNSQYGVGFPAASIDATTLLGSSGDSSYQTYCQACYLALSPVLSNHELASSIMTRWLKLTNTAAVWSGGKLKFVPYGDTPLSGRLATGSTVTFIPNVTPVYDLTDDDIVQEDNKDPIEITRSDPYASYNWQRLHIAQRSHHYDATPIEAFDQNAIELYGLRMASAITANEICDPKVGQVAAQLILQRGLYIRNTYKFKLSFEYCLLEPMDIVTVTDTALGLNRTAIRIIEIEEDESGLLAVTAEEFPAGNATAAQYLVQEKAGKLANQGVVPARVNPPIIFEPPPPLTGNIAQVWIAASAGIAPVYKLAEDSSAGQHSANQTLDSVQSSGTAVTFSAYIQAAERAACRLDFFNGSAAVGCDFNLATGTAAVPDPGVTATIEDAGSGWFQCTVQGAMAASATPWVSVLVEQQSGAQGYPGIAGDGIYVWGAEFAVGDGAPAFLPPFSATSGATLATSGVATPDGASGIADPNWGGCNVWISTDNETYGRIGQITAPARMGVLTASLQAPVGSNPDTAGMLSVSLVESGGELSNATSQEAQSGLTLCLVDGELLSYATATLTGPNAYNLTYLYRGLKAQLRPLIPPVLALLG